MEMEMAKISLPLTKDGNDEGWDMPTLDGATVCGAAPFYNSEGDLIGFAVNVGWNDDDSDNRDIIINAVNAMGERWKPIDTAPRDGTTVMLWSGAWAHSWGELQIGHFEGDGEGGGEWVTAEGAVDDNDPDADDIGADHEDDPDNLGDHNFGPTHWMPMIAGPSA